MGSWLSCRQKRLGMPGVVLMLVFTAFVTPASLDMYTPALPQMVVQFSVDEAALNSTLVAFYVFFAAGQLVLGSVSDRRGRRPVFLAGSIVYIFGSIGCLFARTLIVLMGFRVLQACGAGAIAAISMALVVDLFKPEKRDVAFSLVTSLFGVGPIVAPLLGALLMGIAGWRSIFFALVAFGFGCLAFGFLLEEPLPVRAGGESEESGTDGNFSSGVSIGIANVASSLAEVLSNRGFALYMIIPALFSLPFMAYVAVASHVYVSFFDLTEVEYGVYFAIASVMMIVGPFLWPVASRVMSAKKYTSLLIILGMADGIAFLLFGGSSPAAFCVLVALLMLIEASIRPFTANILLAQQVDDIGAASALTNCSHSVASVVGMTLAVLPWPNFIFGLGALMVLSALIAVVLWTCLLKSNARLVGVKDE